MDEEVIIIFLKPLKIDKYTMITFGKLEKYAAVPKRFTKIMLGMTKN